MKVKRPYVQISINGKNITAELEGYAMDFQYTDNESGKADDVDLTVHNTGGLFSGDWLPTRGDEFKAWIGYRGDKLLPCGAFIIDEFTLTGPPDQLTIRGISAGQNKKVRTVSSAAFENQTLADVVRKVTADAGLTLNGNIASVQIKRVTQNKLTAVQFLNKLANDYGHAFNIRNGAATFTDLFELEQSAPVTALDRIDLISYTFAERSAGTATDATVKYTDPDNYNLIEDSDNGGQIDTLESADMTADALEIFQRAENPTAAKRMAKSALHRANGQQRTATVTVPGHPELVAGCNFELTGMGAFSGTYHVTSARHVVGSGGWIVELECKRIIKTNVVAKTKPSKVRRRRKSTTAPGPIAYYRMGYSGSKEIGAAEIPKFQNTKPRT